MNNIYIFNKKSINIYFELKLIILIYFVFRMIDKLVYRKDILELMLNNTNLSSKDLFNLLINETKDRRRQGLIYETVCIILIILKCISNLNYTKFLNGSLQNLKSIENINDVLDIKINASGNNIVDFTIQNNDTLIPFSIKYQKKYGETDISKINDTILHQNLIQNYKIGLIVKDKNIIKNHNFKNKENNDFKIIKEIIENNLLFDENDIIKGLDVFCQRFSNYKDNLNVFIDFINNKYISSSRQLLIKKFHQKMTELKFMNSFKKSKKSYNLWCMDHKPRSGKSITLLSICKFFLENQFKKILIMTSVPHTINDFKKNLDKYIDFQNISYILQDDFLNINKDFNGIVFCSVQYLKTDKQKLKKNILKKFGFDVIIIDEAHFCSSTDKTKNEILDYDIEEIRKNIKINIFASGTCDKVIKYYNIPFNNIFKWTIEDEGYMKNCLINNEYIELMKNRHGNIFSQCLKDETLDKDYSKSPTQVLMKHLISESLINDIIIHNKNNNSNFGYHCSSLLALRQIINKNGEKEYVEEFAICNTVCGEDILKKYFEMIISNNRMDNTIMKQIENLQTSRNSRKSTMDNPLLFIIYLPTNTQNNTICLLQKTLIKFLKKNKLWSDYNIEYSNSIEDSNIYKETYNEFIKTIMNNTKKKNKKGCILFLGNKGSLGITYEMCDVTISLDDGHNLDNQKQKYYRALTEAEGKTIGINVDLNIQRTYLYLINVIHQFKKFANLTNSTNTKVLYYLFKHNLFLFDPQYINDGQCRKIDIISYYDNEVNNIMKEIDDTIILENIECNDDLHRYIKLDIQQNSIIKKINPDLEGEQLHCPKGNITKILIDITKDSNNKELNDDEIIEYVINYTYEMCKNFLFPLLALISISFNIYDFKLIFIHKNTRKLIKDLLIDKKLEINKYNFIFIKTIMNQIIDNNQDIVDNITEIYRTASPTKLRYLIEKHFIPTKEEKKNNAEISTPVNLVNEMLSKMPIDFWTKPQKVFEPCCGKGNFVLGIFDYFYHGLKELYPNEKERCQIIMTKCIYYADLTILNVFITTELLKCHVKKYCKIDEIEYEFNYNIGNSLELNIKEKWNIDGFEAIIGNPPYNDNSGNKGKNHKLWEKFTLIAINSLLNINGYLMFIHPPGWRQINHKILQIFKKYQLHYLEIHNISDGIKVFKCSITYDWYLLEKKEMYKNTIIIDEEKILNNINIKSWLFIPNKMFNKILKILADDDKVLDVNYYRNNYGADKKWISKIKNEEFKYPVIYTINKSNILSLRYSNTNKNDIFNKSKFVFSNGQGFYCDKKGEYGLTQWSYCIYDNKDLLLNIEKAFKNSDFQKIIHSIKFDSNKYNISVMKLFKKDFWKEFL